MRVAILAVQGAFIEHRKKLESLGAECIELRKKEDLEQPFDGLVLPGVRVPYRESFCENLRCTIS